MKRGLLAFAVTIACGCAAGAASPDQSEKQAAPAIAAKADASQDGGISARIRSIFDEIAALRDVGVRASSGVVTLTGSVPAAADKGRAEAIASRVAGVVTVQNDITRNLDVGTKVAPAT